MDGQQSMDRQQSTDRQRSGAHRPRRSLLVEVVPALLIVLAVAGVAVGAWQLNRTTAATVAASGGPADGAGPGPDATASGSSRPTASTPTASIPTASGSPTSGPVDRSVSVTVLNGTQRSGLAGRAATALRATGWTVRVGNERTTRPTTVVYPSGAQQATAQALAVDLGGSPAVEQSGRYGGARLTVLLGADYAG